MYSIQGDFWFVPLGGALSIGMSYWLARDVLRRPEGTDRMKAVAGLVKGGALAYLKRQYRSSAFSFGAFALVLGLLAAYGLQNPFLPLAFLTGGLFSALSGYIGITAACEASSRTAWALRESLAGGVKVALRAGSVLGLAVAGFSLLDISLWYYILNVIYDHDFFGLGLELAVKAGLKGEEFNALWVTDSIYLKAKSLEIASAMLTFGLGASMYAFISRLGGGIFSQAAHLGADFIGGGDSGIPNNDVRNPAAIAGKVGENVGAVTGVGADLYGSFYCSILSASALGAAIIVGREEASQPGGEIGLILAPMMVAAFGSVLSGVGLLSIRFGAGSSRKELLPSLGRSFLVSAALTTGFIWALCWWFKLGWGLGLSLLTGLYAGLILGGVFRCFTPEGALPTFQVARSALLGPAAIVLDGLATGMVSTFFPFLVVAGGILLPFAFSGGFQELSLGLYGVSLSAVGMLATLASTLSMAAFGPIAGNAEGNAEMAHLDPEIRDRAEVLGALGATTATMGRDFVIGAASLTAMALLGAYAEITRLWDGKLLPRVSHVSLEDFVVAINLTLVNPKLVVGLLLGAMMVFLLCAMILKAVGRTARRMVDEVRRQFMDIQGLIEGEARPDYDACFSIAAAGAQSEIFLPAALSLAIPIFAGLLLGIGGVFGLLIGFLITGFGMAVMLNSAGGVWDNARRFVERGNFGGKGSDVHRACVIGCTVGDPFKDVVAPSLGILVKLLSLVSIVSAGVVIALRG